MDNFEKALEYVTSGMENLKIVFSKEVLTEISEETINGLKEIDANCIYIITGDFKNKEAFAKEYQHLKNAGFHLAKYPNKNFDNYIGTCLYIGTSRKKALNSRLLQHFIYSHPSTYSLHFGELKNYKEYFPNIKVHIYKFQNELDIVKCVEYRLQKELKQLLGQTCLR